MKLPSGVKICIGLSFPKKRNDGTTNSKELS
jgi:hypothetical protein